MSTPVDLAAFRAHRAELLAQHELGVQAYTEALIGAGRAAADLAWDLATPVRQSDHDLTRALYRLILQRLQRASDKTLRGTPAEKTLKPQARGALRDAFTARLFEIQDGERRRSRA